jgi:hypothetical protein
LRQLHLGNLRAVYDGLRDRMALLESEGWDCGGIIAYAEKEGHPPKDRQALNDWLQSPRGAAPAAGKRDLNSIPRLDRRAAATPLASAVPDRTDGKA